MESLSILDLSIDYIMDPTEISISEKEDIIQQNRALKLALKVSEREKEYFKKQTKKWCTQCEELLKSINALKREVNEFRLIKKNRFDIHVNEMRKKQHVKSFDYSSSDEEEN